MLYYARKYLVSAIGDSAGFGKCFWPERRFWLRAMGHNAKFGFAPWAITHYRSKKICKISALWAKAQDLVLHSGPITQDLIPHYGPLRRNADQSPQPHENFQNLSQPFEGQ
jgi:hypothetical protein